MDRPHDEGEEGEEGEEEWDSEEDSWESDLDSEAEIAELMQMDLVDESASTGKQEYLAKCSELNIVPVAMFIAKLECEHINLRHHGLFVAMPFARCCHGLARPRPRSRCRYGREGSRRAVGRTAARWSHEGPHASGLARWHFLFCIGTVQSLARTGEPTQRFDH